MADRLRATAAASEPGFRVSVEDFVYGGLRTPAAARGRTGDVVVLGQPDALDGSTMDTEIFLGALVGSGRTGPTLPGPR